MNNRPSSLRAGLALAALLSCAAVPPALAAGAVPGGDSAPSAPRDAAREALINRVIGAAGLREQMQEMQNSVQESFAASAEKQPGANATPEARARLEKMAAAVGKAFRAEGFITRIEAVLREQYSQAHLRAALAGLNTPLVRRMTEIEKQHQDMSAVAAFAARLRQEPLPLARVGLFARLDVATGASDIGARAVTSTLKLMAYANPGVDKEQAAAAAAQIDGHRGEIINRMRADIAANFAYTYREVSDADLAAYVRAAEGDNLHWLNQKIGIALDREFDAGIARMINAFRNILQPGGAAAAS